MKLRVFHAADGDCLLLTSRDGRHALIDGGRTESFKKATWPVLRKLAVAKEPLDLVVVSHIDADHITGILWLLRVVAAWEVHDYQTSDGGNPNHAEPDVPRPPSIGRFWHNSWRAQLGDLADPIEMSLARFGAGIDSAPVERAALPTSAVRLLEAVEGLAESIPQGVELLRLVVDETPIPLNTPFDRLVRLESPPHVDQLGSTSLTVIGPAPKHLKALQDEWREWLASVDAAPAGPSAGNAGAGPGLAFGQPAGAPEPPGAALVASLVAAAGIIEKTDPTKVTPPNRASITLLAEEDGRTCLLTGDAAEEELLEGLERAGRIVDARFWCNVVKVQHHGSEHNLSRQFAGTVLADDYVFCGDGAHGNPDPRVVRTIIETRRTADPRPFTLWFNSTPEQAHPERRSALRAAIKQATTAAEKHPAVKVRVLANHARALHIRV
jgi:hypothetical protein